MRKLIAATLLGATLFTGAAAYAGQSGPAPGDRPVPGGPLMRADSNGDGVITRDEWMASVDARFARIDKDRDGKISPDERKGFRGPRGAPPEAGGPGARGGEMSLADQREKAMKRFALVDRNGDGRIDKTELDQLRETLMAFGGPPGHGPRGDRHGGPGHGPMPMPPGDMGDE